MYEEYTNYPTWALAQWIHNEQESTEFFGNIASKIYESYTIDKDGSIINPVITNNAEVYIMDKEALRTIMIMPDWIPAEDENGNPIQTKQTTTVNFGSGGGMGGMRF